MCYTPGWLNPHLLILDYCQKISNLSQTQLLTLIHVNFLLNVNLWISMCIQALVFPPGAPTQWIQRCLHGFKILLHTWSHTKPIQKVLLLVNDWIWSWRANSFLPVCGEVGEPRILPSDSPNNEVTLSILHAQLWSLGRKPHHYVVYHDNSSYRHI